MANKIKWVFEMVDKISGPAKSAGASLGDMIQVTHSALAAVQLIGQAAVGAGHMIASGLEPAISREKSLGAFEQLLGTAEEARNMYAQAVKFAAATPYETAQVVQSYKQLLTAQFSKEEVPIALNIIGDAASMSEAPQEALNTIIQQMGQMKSVGRATMEDLQPIFQAAMISQADYIANVADRYGVTIEQARKLQSEGKVSADVASFAALQTMMEKTGGNMDRASRQVGGLVSTLQSRPAEFLAKLQDTRGYDALRNVLSRMANAFDPETSGLTPFLTQLGSGVLERASVTLEYLSSGAVAFMEGLIAGIGPLGEAFGPANQTNMEKFKLIMEGIGVGVGNLAASLGYLASKLKGVWDLIYQVGEFMSDKPWLQRLILGAGGAVAGLQVGAAGGAATGALFGGLGAIPGAVIGGGIGMLAGGTAGAFTPEIVGAAFTDTSTSGGLLRQQESSWSPLSMADAYGLPAFAAGGIVRKPTVALVGESGPEAVVPLSGRSGGSGGSMTVHAPISLTFQGAASASDAQAVAAAVGPAVEAHLFSVLERLALQSGRLA